MAKVDDFGLGDLQQFLKTDEFHDMLTELSDDVANRARSTTPTNWNALRESVGSETTLTADGWTAFVKSSYKAYFQSNKAGKVAEVKPLIKGVYERTGKSRRVQAPLFLETSLWLAGEE